MVADRARYYERPVSYHMRQIARMRTEPYERAQQLPRYTSHHDEEGGALTTPRAASRAVEAWMGVLDDVVAREYQTQLSMVPSQEICSILRLVENELKFSEPISPGWVPLSRCEHILPGRAHEHDTGTSLSATLAATRSLADSVSEARTACFASDEDRFDDDSYENDDDPPQS